MNKKKVGPIFWLVTFSFLVFMLPFPGEAFPIEHNKTEKALRLTIKYENGKMNLLKVEPLQMVIPLKITEQIVKGEVSPMEYFFEIQEAGKNVILRSNMDDPTVTLMEYEDQEHPGQIKSQLVNHKEITFSIIIPAPDKLNFIRFARISQGKEGISLKMQRQEDLGTFDLLKIQQETSNMNNEGGVK